MYVIAGVMIALIASDVDKNLFINKITGKKYNPVFSAFVVLLIVITWLPLFIGLLFKRKK
jgi:hypothetical protein